MTSNLAIKLCVAGWMCLQWGPALRAQPPRQNGIRAVAHIDGRTKEVDGIKYHLIAMRLHPMVPKRILDGGYSGWVINGQRGRDMMLPVEAHEQVTRESSGEWVLQQWIRLPASGDLEILTGVIDTFDISAKELDNVETLRAELLKQYLPYKIKVEEIPPIQVFSVSDAVKKLRYLSQRKEAIRAVAHVNGRVQTVDGQRYCLLAVLVQWPLTTGAISARWQIDGQDSRKAFLPQQPEVFDDKLHVNVKLEWVRVPPWQKRMLLLVGSGHLVYDDTDREIQQKLLERGYLPYGLDLAMLPQIEAKTAAELEEELKVLAKAKLGTKEKWVWDWWSSTVH